MSYRLSGLSPDSARVTRDYEWLMEAVRAGMAWIDAGWRNVHIGSDDGINLDEPRIRELYGVIRQAN